MIAVYIIGVYFNRFIDEPISKRYPVYSYNHCLLECRIQMIKKLCGCVPHFYKNLGKQRNCFRLLSDVRAMLPYEQQGNPLLLESATGHFWCTKLVKSKVINRLLVILLPLLIGTSVALSL